MTEHAIPHLAWTKTEFGITRLTHPSGLLPLVTLRHLFVHIDGPATGSTGATEWLCTTPANLREIAAQRE